MKKSWTFQKSGNEFSLKDIEGKVLDEIKEKGIKKKDIEHLNFYLNGNEGQIYYAALDTEGKELLNGKCTF